MVKAVHVTAEGGAAVPAVGAKFSAPCLEVKKSLDARLAELAGKLLLKA